MRLVLLALLAGCFDPVDARWQLDHDHVVAVRATPPRIMPGEHAVLDALVAHASGPTTIETATDVTAPAAPAALQGAVSFDGTSWIVTAPSEEALATTRPVMGLAADAPVPLELLLVFERAAGDPRFVKKTIWFGAHVENPPVPAILVDGMPAPAALAVPVGRDVYVEAIETLARVNWLTSCGTLFQDDVARAFLRVDEPARGELAIVVRTPDGGVAWQIWPISAH